MTPIQELEKIISLPRLLSMSDVVFASDDLYGLLWSYRRMPSEPIYQLDGDDIKQFLTLVYLSETQ